MIALEMIWTSTWENVKYIYMGERVYRSEDFDHKWKLRSSVWFQVDTGKISK